GLDALDVDVADPPVGPDLEEVDDVAGVAGQVDRHLAEEVGDLAGVDPQLQALVVAGLGLRIEADAVDLGGLGRVLAAALLRAAGDPARRLRGVRRRRGRGAGRRRLLLLVQRAHALGHVVDAAVAERALAHSLATASASSSPSGGRPASARA